MDLAAYMQIDDLEKIAKDNGIEVPRLRGYRLMKDEESVSIEEINKIMERMSIEVCQRLCRSEPYWANSDLHEYSDKTDRRCDYYLISSIDEDGYRYYSGIRWDRIHGWKRKVLKFEIKKQNRRIQKQFDMWNKYVGKENVLYIHSRIGGCNWNYYDGNALMKKSWFLDKIDDYFDDTYCDIYALIK
jgi:hypothetical protein